MKLFILIATIAASITLAFGSSKIDSKLQISGIYPDLTTYTLREDVPLKDGNECGIGGIVPWVGKLYMINYGAHYPNGSTHSLYIVDNDLNMIIHPDSVGGTPAGRMIHKESNQLLIGPYLIDKDGKVRVITPKAMPSRITAIARHLKDPANWVYYYDMEGMLYEANVNTLEVKKLFHDTVPGVHGKGGYTSQGRLVISNNGQGNNFDSPENWQVKAEKQYGEVSGSLAQWDGEKWEVIEQHQFTDITGPGGIHGAPDDKSPLWAMGWDKRSIRLKLLDGGKWYTYLLPKAAHNNDPVHGWFTEWPRIREITDGLWMMDMHGMFYNFPKTFSIKNTSGISPISSHIRYIPDFCEWNGKLVIASDETSIQGNKMSGQAQCNLWFGNYEDLKTWGPASGWGGPWINDEVKANTPSDPFLLNGFDRRILHLAVGGGQNVTSSSSLMRCTDRFEITNIPEVIAGLTGITIERGDFHKPAPGYEFNVNQDVTVYIVVDERGKPGIGDEWKKTDMTVKWTQNLNDNVYVKSFPKGRITIPGNNTEHKAGDYGLPHTTFVKAETGELLISDLTSGLGARVNHPRKSPNNSLSGEPRDVTVTMEIDTDGKGNWEAYKTVNVQDYTYCIIPEKLDAQWMRMKVNKDSIMTAYFHMTDDDAHKARKYRKLFAGLADIDETKNISSAVIYAAKRNRNLRIITSDQKYYDFAKQTFAFNEDEPDENLKKLLSIEPEFTVDAASVVIQAKNGVLRLPKGTSEYDKPFIGGWPRCMREVESERMLANIHGTFYEVPIDTIGDRDHMKDNQFSRLRPVTTHNKQIADFCTWNGLLVLTGVDKDAEDDGHIFKTDDNNAALWFGGIDDLWKMGKPVGTGGPWKDTAVKAGIPSDPYLMTGFDEKSVELTADKDVIISMEVNFDHISWHHHKTFELSAGKKITHTFPKEFSAHWVRVKADKDCKATAWFIYK